ncbi:3-ketoacyl-reductase [Hyaloraphidium curvatum]|nr:3-ketoacyl-reductase [Hyaloraphidium curvatum]
MATKQGSLAGKVAVVTGAGSGFGEGIAHLFAKEGAKVVIADLREDAAQRVCGDINKSYPGAAVSCKADVSSRADTKKMIAAGVEFGGTGRLDIIVNNAGFSHTNQSCLETTEDIYDRVFNVNVKSIYHAVQEVVPIMEKQGGGSIVNVASTAGLRPRPGLTWYNSSKGAVITMTKSLAVELAPQQIRVNALCPVAGDTPLLPTFLGEDTPERREMFRKSIPLGRLSTPQDIANAALWLCIDASNFITGLALEVDGGRCV